MNCHNHGWITLFTLQGYSPSQQNYCKEGMGAMFVYDVQTKTSLQNLRWYRETLNSLVTKLNGDPIPAVLVGNKVTIEQYSTYIHKLKGLKYFYFIRDICLVPVSVWSVAIIIAFKNYNFHS